MTSGGGRGASSNVAGIVWVWQRLQVEQTEQTEAKQTAQVLKR